MKTIGKRIEKKQQFVLEHLMRRGNEVDPLSGEQGGSPGVLERELQSIGDMQEHIVRIWTAIFAANDTTRVTVGDRTRTIGEWLIWKDKVSRTQSMLLTSIQRSIDQRRRTGGGNSKVVIGQDQARPEDTIVHVDEKRLQEAIEKFEQTVGELDGQLSLKNATVRIDI